MNTAFWFVFFSLLLSALFAGMEIAFLTSNKLRIELDKKQGKLYTQPLALFLKHPADYISTMLMGNNITLVVYGIAMAQLCDPFIMRHITTSNGWILFIETVFSTFIILTTADFLPKMLCRINPNKVLKIFSWVALVFYILLYPATKFVSLLSVGILRMFGAKVSTKQNSVLFDKADLMNLSNEVSGIQDEEEYDHDIEIFQNALDFPEVRIRECMVPRTEITAIEENDTPEKLKHYLIDTGYSRILVYRNTIDNIIGYVHSKDLFTKPTVVSIKEILRPIDFVQETMPAKKLLASLTKNRKALAVVLDEFGGTSGIVTMEDIMEEIFGEIDDEYDSSDLLEQKISDMEYEFSGRIEVKYINKTYALNIPESDEYETLAGYIMFCNENIPEQGEILQFDNFRFQILETSATKIERVHLTLLEEEF